MILFFSQVKERQEEKKANIVPNLLKGNSPQPGAIEILGISDHSR